MKRLLVVIVLALMFLVGGIYWSRKAHPESNTPQAPSVAQVKQAITGDLIVAAAGDISCEEDEAKTKECQQAATAKLIGDIKPNLVLPLGDIQYNKGELEDFQKYYDKTWGKFKDITYPAVGNHEYETRNASGYFTYFGDRAGDPAKGYYSFNARDWHFISINANCGAIGGCNLGSPQLKWLEEDLKNHQNTCTLAYWHQPRFSSGNHGNNGYMETVWQTLSKYNVDLVLSGHDHDYERFAPERGIREFVVGTGGKDLYAFRNPQPGSEVRDNSTFGVLKLALKKDSYDWEFVPIEGGSFKDSGSDKCH